MIKHAHKIMKRETYGICMRPPGVCAPLIPENNALISPNPWKKIPQLPLTSLLKILKINSASPQIPKNIKFTYLKTMKLYTSR